MANKVDGVHAEAAVVEFYQLGFGEPLHVAASHGRGVAQMLEEVLSDVPEDESQEEHDKNTGLRLAVIGRPNVGKSTLVNRLLVKIVSWCTTCQEQREIRFIFRMSAMRKNIL